MRIKSFNQFLFEFNIINTAKNIFSSERRAFKDNFAKLRETLKDDEWFDFLDNWNSNVYTFNVPEIYNDYGSIVSDMLKNKDNQEYYPKNLYTDKEGEIDKKANFIISKLLPFFDKFKKDREECKRIIKLMTDDKNKLSEVSKKLNSFIDLNRAKFDEMKQMKNEFINISKYVEHLKNKDDWKTGDEFSNLKEPGVIDYGADITQLDKFKEFKQKFDALNFSGVTELIQYLKEYKDSVDKIKKDWSENSDKFNKCSNFNFKDFYKSYGLSQPRDKNNIYEILSFDSDTESKYWKYKEDLLVNFGLTDMEDIPKILDILQGLNKNYEEFEKLGGEKEFLKQASTTVGEILKTYKVKYFTYSSTANNLTLQTLSLDPKDRDKLETHPSDNHAVYFTICEEQDLKNDAKPYGALYYFPTNENASVYKVWLDPNAKMLNSTFGSFGQQRDMSQENVNKLLKDGFHGSYLTNPYGKDSQLEVAVFDKNIIKKFEYDENLTKLFVKLKKGKYSARDNNFNKLLVDVENDLKNKMEEHKIVHFIVDNYNDKKGSQDEKVNYVKKLIELFNKYNKKGLMTDIINRQKKATFGDSQIERVVKFINSTQPPSPLQLQLQRLQ